MRKCPFDDCAASVAPDRFACRRCWFRLSRDHRDMILNAWRNYRLRLIPLEEMKQIQQHVLDQAQGKEQAK